MSVPICNRFHTKRANDGKITFEGNPRTQGHESLSRKTRDLVGTHGKNFVILACTVLIQFTSVTDRQTPRPWLRRAKHSAITRKKETLRILRLEFLCQPQRRVREPILHRFETM